MTNPIYTATFTEVVNFLKSFFMAMNKDIVNVMFATSNN
jgi:hypothetical protein